MPEKYLKIRDKLKAQGKSSKAAKTTAAKIYNSQRPKGTKPVTPAYDAKRKK